MHLKTIKLLASVAIVLCVACSSKKSSLALLQADRSSTDYSHGNDRNAVNDDEAAQVYDAKDREERAPFASEDLASILKMAGDLSKKLRESSHLGPTVALCEEVLACMKALKKVLAAQEALKKHPEQREIVTQVISQGPIGSRDVLRQSQIAEEEHAIQAPTTMLALGIEGPTRDTRINFFIEQVQKFPNYFPDLKSLQILKQYAEEWSAAESKQYTLLDALLIVYGDVAQLAPALSKAKLNSGSKVEATRLQNELLSSWMCQGETYDDVFGILKLSGLVTRGLKYEDLDTFERYIDLCNRHTRGNKARLGPQLALKFNHADILKMILDPWNEPKYVKIMMETRYTYWRKYRYKFATIERTLKGAGFGESACLDILSEFYGEDEVRYAIMNSKMSSFFKSRLKRRQTWLVKDLLNSAISIDGVYNLLKLYESKNDAMTKERMKIFQEYVQLRSKDRPDKIDAEQYRNQKLAEAARMDQERAEKRQRIKGSKDLLSRLGDGT